MPCVPRPYRVSRRSSPGLRATYPTSEIIPQSMATAGRSQPLNTVAEVTLTLVLFADASRISVRALRREYAVPLRLLGLGLPLTIAAGAAV